MAKQLELVRLVSSHAVAKQAVQGGPPKVLPGVFAVEFEDNIGTNARFVLSAAQAALVPAGRSVRITFELLEDAQEEPTSPGRPRLAAVPPAPKQPAADVAPPEAPVTAPGPQPDPPSADGLAPAKPRRRG